MLSLWAVNISKVQQKGLFIVENSVRNKYYKNHQSQCGTQFPSTLVPSKSTLLTDRFQKIDSFLMTKQRQTKSVLSEETTDIGALPEVSPRKSLRVLSQETSELKSPVPAATLSLAYCEVDITASISRQQPYHFHCRSHT